LRLAKYAKSCGVKVLFYISPQVWAWRQKRVYKIRKVVDMMAVVFPFEETFYKKYSVPVTYVGHPLTGEVCASKDKDQLIKDFHLAPKTKHVGLFPGSRKSEIKRLLPIILKSANKLAEYDKNIEFLLPIASTLSKDDFLPYLGKFAHLRIHLIENQPYDVMKASDAIVTVSGTVTLEIALIGTPMVIINKLSWITYLIVRRMIKIKYIGLCNIIANRQLVPELVQCLVKPVLIAKLLNKILCNIDYANQLKENLEHVKLILAEDKNKKDISDVTLEMLGK
jgi:lipid-A-disaccharide synthase